MPLITKNKKISVKEITGMICDVCGELDSDLTNDFKINHTFGYGSRLDMCKVSATICDNCLVDIILEKVPGAVFTDNDKILSHDEVK